jgi:hypothetical protein
MTTTLLLIAFLAAMLVAAPFPIWSNYFYLWKNVVFTSERAIPGRARLKHAGFLTRHLLSVPIYSMLWYLDEAFFRGYRRVKIHPVFIVGQPRSGSTFLHRTLAADEEHFVAIRHFEWRYPYITIQKLIRVLQLEPLLQRVNYWPANNAGSKAAQMHPNTLFDWEEDGIFFEEKLLCHYFIILRFPYLRLLPRMDDFSALTDKQKRKCLALHEAAIKKVIYLRGNNRIYLSKDIENMSKLPFLAERYPDARFLLIVRESRFFFNSYLRLISLSVRAKSSIDADCIERWKTTHLLKKRHDCRTQMAFAHSLLETNKVELSCNVLVRDTEATIRLIYDRLQLPVNSAHARVLARIQKQQDARSRPYTYSEAAVDGFDEFDIFARAVEARHLENIRLSSSESLSIGTKGTIRVQVCESAMPR